MQAPLSPLAAWALSLGCAVGWGSFVMPGTTFLPQAGPLGTTVAFAVGSLAILVIAADYAVMVGVLPKERGMYAYVRHALGPNHAFVCVWCLLLSYGMAIVANATALALVVRVALGPVLHVGLRYTFAGYDVWLGEALLGLVTIALVFRLSRADVTVIGAVEKTLVIGLMLGVVVVLVEALRHPQEGFQPMEPAFSPHLSPMAVAVLCGMVLYAGLSVLATLAAPEGYASWAAYVDELAGQEGLASIPTFFVAREPAGPVGLGVLTVAAVCGALSGVVGFFVAATGLIRDMAADGAIHRDLAQVDPQTRAPLRAARAVLLATVAIPFLGRNVLDWTMDLMSLGALLAYAYVSLSVLLHGLGRDAGGKRSRVDARRADDGAGTGAGAGVGKRVVGRYVVLGVAGFVVSVVQIVLLIVPIPGFGSSLGIKTYLILLAWLALGLNFFTPTVSLS